MWLEDEIFTSLENKLESLFTKVKNFKRERNNLELEIKEQKGKIKELESENRSLKKEIVEVKNNNEIRQKKLDLAAEKIQGLLGKLEAVEV